LIKNIKRVKNKTVEIQIKAQVFENFPTVIVLAAKITTQDVFNQQTRLKALFGIFLIVLNNAVNLAEINTK